MTKKKIQKIGTAPRFVSSRELTTSVISLLPDEAGSAFPVLVKFIDAAQNLSVQVHPDDEYARRVEGDNGKTEMWYILQGDEGAGFYCGFARDTAKE